MKAKIQFSIKILLLFSFTACQSTNSNNSSSQLKAETITFDDPGKIDTATFAGGCFWCVEAAFEQIKGVEAVVSGYSGGPEKDPKYREVASGATGHAESVQVYYNSEIIDYVTLLDIFFTAHDPTQLNRQGPDVGPQYRSAIFFHDQQQKKLAQQKIKNLGKSGRFNDPIVTKLNKFKKFWIAEDYHQDYEEKHPNDPYIQNVSRPKIDKVKEKFSHLLKEEKA